MISSTDKNNNGHKAPAYRRESYPGLRMFVRWVAQLKYMTIRIKLKSLPFYSSELKQLL